MAEIARFKKNLLETLKQRKRVATDDIQKSNAEPKKRKPLNGKLEAINYNNVIFFYF